MKVGERSVSTRGIHRREGGRHPFVVRARWDPDQQRSTRELVDLMENKRVQVEVATGWGPAIWSIARMFHKPEIRFGDRRLGGTREKATSCSQSSWSTLTERPRSNTT